MNAKRLWQIGGVILILGIFAAGWFLLISPIFDQAAKNDAAAAGVESQNASLRTQISALQAIDQAALEERIREFEVGVPRTPSMTSMTRDIKAVVETTGATLTSVSYTESATFAPGGSGVDEDGEPVTPSDSSTWVPLPILQRNLDAAVDAGLIVITVNVNVSGDRDQVLAAADALQHAANRTLLVTSISLRPSGGDSTGSGSISAIAWVLPSEPIGGAASS